MGFIRCFDSTKINKLTGENAALYECLKNDVLAGEVFSAVRSFRIDFYHKGGCLYEFNGNSFKRSKAYNKYNANTEWLKPYEKAKQQNYNRFKGSDEKRRERQLLDKLNRHTFGLSYSSKVVVLDIEVCFSGTVSRQKKCDLVLMNTETREIMFVEGKDFYNGDVNVKAGYTSKVIKQINDYSSAIKEQQEVIEIQYAKHIQIINQLFGTNYNQQVKIIIPAKLLVYNTPISPNANGCHSIDTINAALGSGNAVWHNSGEAPPSIDEIWDALLSDKDFKKAHQITK